MTVKQKQLFKLFQNIFSARDLAKATMKMKIINLKMSLKLKSNVNLKRQIKESNCAQIKKTYF